MILGFSLKLVTKFEKAEIVVTEVCYIGSFQAKSAGFGAFVCVLSGFFCFVWFLCFWFVFCLFVCLFVCLLLLFFFA